MLGAAPKLRGAGVEATIWREGWRRVNCIPTHLCAKGWRRVNCFDASSSKPRDVFKFAQPSAGEIVILNDAIRQYGEVLEHGHLVFYCDGNSPPGGHGRGRPRTGDRVPAARPNGRRLVAGGAGGRHQPRIRIYHPYAVPGRGRQSWQWQRTTSAQSNAKRRLVLVPRGPVDVSASAKAYLSLK